MTLLHRSVPARWVAVTFVIIALMMTMRVRDVLALNEAPAAKDLLERAHTEYLVGDYAAAFEFAKAAVEESPRAPTVLVQASDYAFVLGMSRYEPLEFWHTEAFEAGLDYTARAHKLDPENPEMHRAWAEGLLFAYLYEVPVDREELLDSWVSMRVDNWADSVYRKTAIRIVSTPEVESK